MLAALLAYGLWHLGFSFTKFILGIANLGNFVVLMFPPSWGDQESLYRYVHALGETVAIAFLGTLLAAIIAFSAGLCGRAQHNCFKCAATDLTPQL